MNEPIEIKLFLHLVHTPGDEAGEGEVLEHHEFSVWATTPRGAAAIVRAFYENPEGTTSVHRDTLARFPQGR